MSKRIFLLTLLLAFSAATMQCSAQAEGSPEDQSSENEIAQALLYKLGFVNTGGSYWSGSAAINSCIGTTVEASVYCGSLIAKGQTILDENVDSNMFVSLTSVQGSNVTSKLILLAPHFNMIPFGYEFGMQGTITESSKTTNTSMILAQTSVLTNLNTGYNILLTNFVTNNIEGNLTGTVTAELSTASVNGNVILEYNLSLKREF